MRYLLDFDRTLMDTDQLREVVAIEEKLHLVGVPSFWNHFSASEFLYEDVVPWLLEKEKEQIHILTAFKPSQGEFAKLFQEGKIDSGGISAHIGSVTVMEGLKGKAAAAIVSKWPAREQIVFVDDLIEQCLSVKEAVPEAHCFLICRNGRPEAPLPAGLTAVTTLEEVDAMMEKNL